MHGTMLNHARFRYLWVAIALCVGSIVAYWWHQPIGVPNGGTYLGYTLGTIAALLIVWLMLLGMRKRSYSGSLGTVRGWTSAHIYLGTSLILIATLHCGFQFGWNIHTLCYSLMLLVIFSGFFGVFAYLRYPALMTRNRSNTSRSQMLDEIAELDKSALQLADQVDQSIHDVVLRSIQRTRLGGNFWQQLTAKDGSGFAIVKLRQAVLQRQQDQSAKKPASSEGQTMVMMVDFLSHTQSDKQADSLRKLLDTMGRKQMLAAKAARDIQYAALMEIWLYIHVPISFALLAALISHIVSVFFYW
jgi:hypothetical protein